MFNGYTESQEKIEARKRRILASYKPAKRNTHLRTLAPYASTGVHQVQVKRGGKKARPKV